MSIQEILTYGGGVVLALLTMVEITPIKINPWSALAKIIGRAVNADVLRELGEVKAAQREMQRQLDKNVRISDERNADELRARILQFNNELKRYLTHDEEAYVEILAEIKAYEKYCDDHSEYPNSRAVCAITNIRQAYDEHLAKHDFL